MGTGTSHARSRGPGIWDPQGMLVSTGWAETSSACSYYYRTDPNSIIFPRAISYPKRYPIELESLALSMPTTSF